MKIEGPEIYELAFTPTEFTVLCAKGTNRFSGLATNDLPKLYIASIDKKPVYVGLTKQSIRNRLRLGWNAVGQGGYYGYTWRHGNDKATLSVWCQMDAVDRNERDIETVEAEVVFLIRSAGQWPAFQTEIHFHPSTDVHREVAADIMSTTSFLEGCAKLETNGPLRVSRANCCVRSPASYGVHFSISR